MLVGGVGCRCGSDLALLCRRLVAVFPLGPPAWKPPYAARYGPKKTKKKKKKIISHSRLVRPSILSSHRQVYKVSLKNNPGIFFFLFCLLHGIWSPWARDQI